MSDPITITSSKCDNLLFVGMSADEELGELFRFDLQFESEDANIDLTSLLGSSMTVTLALQDGFERHFAARYRGLMRAKLGLGRDEEGDDRLAGDLLAVMARSRADYTLTFRGLSSEVGPRAGEAWLARFGAARVEAQAWLERWRARTVGEDLSGLDRVNPKYVLRNWVAETAIRAVEDRGDLATLDRIFRLLRAPFDDHAGDDAFAAPPPPGMCGLEVSCSS